MTGIVKLLRGRKSRQAPFGNQGGRRGILAADARRASRMPWTIIWLRSAIRFNYVYYVGDIDREGARIVEQARNANVVEIRLHAGMYRAMLAEHKRRVKPAASASPRLPTKACPQNLAATIKDRPWSRACSSRKCAARGRAHSAGDSDDRRLSGWRLGKLRPHAEQ